MDRAIAIIKDSFKITGRGIILELKHYRDGLSINTRLTSEKSGLEWVIIARVLFDHAIDQQKIFENEKFEFALLRFESQEKRRNSIKRIKNRESQNIFQYVVKPLNHNQKSEEGEELIINDK